MHNGLYITATGPMTGKSAIALGAMQLLTRSMRKVAFFRPIINEPLWDDRDPDIHLMLEYFKLKMDYADTFAYTQREARQIINQGSRNLLIETSSRSTKNCWKPMISLCAWAPTFLPKTRFSSLNSMPKSRPTLAARFSWLPAATM
jgi:BioD-like N-terminal domain of phosphotransacetylase